MLKIIEILGVAFVTALGSGTLRDLLLDRHPLFWMLSPEYVLLILAMALAAAIIKKTRKLPLSDRAVVVPDAFGSCFFTATGTSVSMTACIVTGFALRLIAVRYDLKLPL